MGWNSEASSCAGGGVEVLLADPLGVERGDRPVDRLARKARRGDRDLDLLPLEFKLLEVLALNLGRVVTRAMLLEQVWRFQFDPRTSIVETHINRLRRKLDAPGAPSCIATVRGAGYVLSHA